MLLTRKKRRKQKLTQAHLERMCIGRRYWYATLKSIPEATHKDLLRKYVKDLEQNFEEGVGLFFWGQNSTGKTYAATAFLKYVVAHGYTAFCIVSDELKLAFLENREADEETTLDRAMNVEFLLIEDLGKEYSTNKGFAEIHFEGLLRHRSRELLPTLITTNLTTKEFKDRYKQSTAAIALESMIAVQVKGKDWRREAFDQNVDKLK